MRWRTGEHNHQVQQKLDDFAQFAKEVFDSEDGEKKLELYESMKQSISQFEQSNPRAKKRKLHETINQLKSMREIKVHQRGNFSLDFEVILRKLKAKNLCHFRK